MVPRIPASWASLISSGLIPQKNRVISEYVPNLEENPEMLSFMVGYTSMGFLSVLIFFALGIVVTMVAQGADVGTKNHRHGLLEAHKAGIHKTHHHHSGGTRTLEVPSVFSSME